MTLTPVYDCTLSELRDLLNRQVGALPCGEPAGDFGGSSAQRQLRTHRVLAQIDRALTLRVEQVPWQGNGNRARRSAVTPALVLRAQVQQPRIATLQKLPHLLRIERTHDCPSAHTTRRQ
jgi:hypothetical protein